MSTDPPPSTANDAALSTPESFSGADIVARTGRYYRNTRYLMCLMLIVMGCWFLYDGFVKYPRENEIVNRLKVEGEDARRRSDQAARTRR